MAPFWTMLLSLSVHSILGPLLFNIAMNSITNLPLSPGANLILYANDVLLYKPVNSETDIEQLQRVVDLVYQWMQSQGLTPKPNYCTSLATGEHPPSHQLKWSPNIILQVSEIPRCHNLIKPHLVRAYYFNVQEGQTPPGTTPSQSLPFTTSHP